VEKTAGRDLIRTMIFFPAEMKTNLFFFLIEFFLGLGFDYFLEINSTLTD